MKKIDFILWIFLTVACLSCPSLYGQEIRIAKSGILDLSKYDFEKEGAVKLNGQWEFYWEQYLQSADFEKIKPSIQVVVPSAWTNVEIEKGVKLGSKGHATYRLRVILPPEKREKMLWGIRTQFVGTNHAIFIQNVLANQPKNLGTSPADTDGNINPSVYYFKAEGDTLSIVLHVANYVGRVGGLTQPLFLGTYKQISGVHETGMMISFFLFGVLIVIGAYHFGLHFFRRKENTALWFALFCFTIGLRILFTDDYYFSDLFPDAPYEVGNKLSYLTFYMGVPLFVIFVRSLYPQDFLKQVVRACVWIGSLFSLVVIFTKTTFYSQFLIYFQLFTLLLICYAIYFVVRILVKHRSDSLIFTIGIVTIFITAINDILAANFILQTPSMMPLGLFVFILSQTIILSKKFSNAFNEVETLTGKLQENNDRLESMVRRRTIALDEANVILSQNLEEMRIQNKALNEANKTKDKLFSIIAHDLRNPVAALKNTIDILDPNILTSNELDFVKAELSRQFSSMDFTLNNLLIWAKAQMKGEEIKQENINIQELILKNIELYRPQFEAKKLHFVNQIAPTAQVYADLNYLRFVLRNLVNNAIKFSHKEGTITMTAIEKEHEVLLSVQDTGVGMSAKQQEKLFKSNSSSEGTAGERGTGLGLILSKEFVEKSGGKIWVESEEGKGSTFYFTLPRG